MGFADTVKKMFGKDKNKGKGKKPDKSNFYLESDKKKPPKDTYNMSGIEDIGEMPDRNPNGPNNSGMGSERPNRPNRRRENPSRSSGREGINNPSQRSQRGNQNVNRSPNSQRPPGRTQGRSNTNSDLPQMPSSEPKKGNLPDLDRGGPMDNLNNSRNQAGGNDMDRIMDRLDDIENRLRSIERGVRRRQWIKSFFLFQR